MQRMAVIALTTACLLHALGVAIIAEANYGYSLGAADVSPFIRGLGTAVLVAVLSVAVWSTRTVTLDALTTALLAYLVVGGIVGLIYAGPTYEYFRHAFAAVTMLVAYACGIKFTREIVSLQNHIYFWAWITLAAGIAVVIYCIPAMKYSAFTLSPGPLLLSLEAGIARGSVFLSTLSGLVIVFGNKRAVLFGACVIVVILAMRRAQGLSTVARTGAAAALCIPLYIAATGVAYITGKTLERVGFTDLTLTSRAERVVRAIEEATPSPPGVTTDLTPPSGASKAVPPPLEPTAPWLERFSSARVTLAEGAIASVSQSWSRLLLGQGFGAVFTWRYWSDTRVAWVVATMSQIDIAPLWFLITAGVGFSILIPALIAWTMGRIVVVSLKQGLGVGALFVIGLSFDMLLSFSPNTALFWFLLGAYSTEGGFVLRPGVWVTAPKAH